MSVKPSQQLSYYIQQAVIHHAYKTGNTRKQKCRIFKLL